MQQASTFLKFQELVGVATENSKPSEQIKGCLYRFRVYPTKAMEDEYKTNQPMIFAIVAASIFIFTSLIFAVYDFLVRRRQTKIMDNANRTNAIVTQLFPQTVRDRLFERSQNATGGSSKSKMENFLAVGPNGVGFETEPIADLFTHCTVLFFDIAGKSALFHTV